MTSHLPLPPDQAQLDRYHAAAAICRSLTDPKRLALLDLLRNGERSAGELAESVGCTLANASQHLAILRYAGLVETRRRGTSILYRLALPEILDACDTVARLVTARAGAQRAGAA